MYLAPPTLPLPLLAGHQHALDILGMDLEDHESPSGDPSNSGRVFEEPE